jgi:protein-S-isoprenylcysteine O-methyltransferase
MCSLANQIISICWGTFLVVWVVASVFSKRSVYRERREQRLRYMLLLVVAFVLLFDARRLPHPFDFRPIPCTNTIASACATFSVAGLAFCIWARIILGRNWSGTVTLKEDHELIVRGPYRIVRHPIYTGLFVMWLATAILSGRIGGLISLPIVFASFWIKLLDEEAVMLNQFPDQYAVYQQRVKRIIPFML